MSKRDEAEALVRGYYAAFNARDWAGMLSLLTDDVAHDVNQGGRETGRAAFEAFMVKMDRHYAEQLRDVSVWADEAGARVAAEFTVHGTYKVTDEGLPAANGQTYVLPAGAFFDMRDGRIARVSNFYNLTDWMAQVG